MFNGSLFALRHHPRQRCHLIRVHGGGLKSTKFIIRIPPTVVEWLLQYSGSRVEHEDGFSSHKCFAVRFKMVNSIWILGFHKNNGFWWWKLKMK